jgi:hypothetical protein
LGYALRGAELAVAIADQDTDALQEVCSYLSKAGNGPGALLLAIDENGVIRPGLERSLSALPPDRVLVHESVSAKGQETLANRWPGRVGDWRRKVVDAEIHPWWLIRDPSAHDVPLPMPALTSGIEPVLSAVLWGEIDSEDLETIKRQFDLIPTSAPELFMTLLDAQITRRSPLGWAARFTDLVECVNGPNQRALFVLDEDVGFDDLALFWNLRSRYPTHAGECAIIGLPIQCLADANRFSAAITQWLESPPHGVKPEILVDVTEASAPTVQGALELAGLTYVDKPGWTVFTATPADRCQPEFGLGRTTIPARLRRGVSGDALVTLREGSNPLHLPVPSAFPPGAVWRGPISVELSGLPLYLPVSDPLASACWDQGEQCGDHILARLLRVQDVIRTTVRLPPPDFQLARHLSSVSLRAEASGAGQLARTLLDRLTGPGDLDALARPHALKLLEALVAPTRKKLAQRVRQELEGSPTANVDEARIVELLTAEGLFAELAAKTVVQLQGSIGTPASEFLEALGGLCDAGYLQRGRAFVCPACRIGDYRRLAELDDRITCRACRHEFALPAVENGAEAATAYRLDGLVGRAMDQDILPVLLALRYLLRRPEATNHAYWWPGLNLYASDSRIPDEEIDLLIADHGTVIACEIKKDAGSLSADDAIAHIELATRLRAEAVFAAPTGNWRAEVTELFSTHDLSLFGPSDLLDAAV